MFEDSSQVKPDTVGHCFPQLLETQKHSKNALHWSKILVVASSKQIIRISQQSKHS